MRKDDILGSEAFMGFCALVCVLASGLSYDNHRFGTSIAWGVMASLILLAMGIFGFITWNEWK